jgi:hypothetical protein
VDNIPEEAATRRASANGAASHISKIELESHRKSSEVM